MGGSEPLVNTLGSERGNTKLMDVAQRKAKLLKCLNGGISNSTLSTKEYQQGVSFLENHDVFCLWDSDRGVTNLVEMTIETGEAAPK